MTSSLYLLHYLLLVFIIDHTTFFSDVPFLNRFCTAFPSLSHPLTCSLCASWWFTLIAVLFFGVCPWFLILPFLSSETSRIVDLVKALINSVITFLLKWL